MGAISIIIWLMIIGLVVWIILVGVSRISGSNTMPQGEMSLAYSREDFLRQALWSLAAFLGVIVLRMMSIRFGWGIDWYWFWGGVGCLAIVLGFFQRAPVLFLVGIAQLFVGTIQAGFVLNNDYSVQYGILILIPVGLLAGMKSASLWLEDYPKAKRYALTLEVLSLVGLLAVPIIYGALSSQSLWADLRQEGDVLVWSSVWAVLLLIFTSKDVVIGLGLKAWKKGLSLVDLVVPALWTIIYGTFLLIPSVSPVDWSRYYSGAERSIPADMIAPVIIMNSVFIGSVAWLMYEGVKNKQIWKLNISILALFVFVIQRYFDWFQNSFLDRSLFFIILGILFLGAGYLLEQLRIRLIEEVTDQDHG